jgi:hypothetical protein
MKKVLVLVCITVFLFACNQSSVSNNAEEVHHHDASESTELTLNNGAKWQADSNTNRHLAGIKTMANMFRVAPSPTADRYQIFGSDIQMKLDTLVRDCTLKGAPDEALHKWMMPILRQSRDLKKVSDTAKARLIFDSLYNRINIYYDYFE